MELSGNLKNIIFFGPNKLSFFVCLVSLDENF